MESQIVEGIKQLGAFGLLVLFGKYFFAYLNNRTSRADEREKELMGLHREQQIIASNHIQHSTEAMNRLTEATLANTQASNKIAGSVDANTQIIGTCDLVQRMRRKDDKQ